MPVIKQAVHALAMAHGIVTRVRKRQERQSGWSRHFGICATRTATMFPNHQTFGRLRHKTFPLGHRAAVAVIHSIRTLPLLLGRTFEDVGERQIRK
ncbi:MAG: hypothetical protein JWM68_2208 [Verrucomicrobiales bacterium]|nr:hypothetical protein [Verrucomicrobiales bacterium]